MSVEEYEYEYIRRSILTNSNQELLIYYFAETNLIFVDFFIQDVIAVADFLSWFLGLFNLSPEFGDVLLKHTDISCK